MIRRYTLADIPFIVELEKRCLGTTLGREMLEADVESEMNHSYVYEESGRIIGYVSLVFDGYAVEILNFCVDIPYQNQGRGTRFLCEILDMYYRLNAISFILEVRRGNQRANHIYEKLGFQPLRLRKGYYADGEDAVVLQKLFIPVGDIEDAYLQCFAEYEYHPDYIRIYDTAQPNKYYHNFYKLLPSEHPDKRIEELYSLSLEMPYVQFMTDSPLQFELLRDFERENNIYLHANIYRIQSLGSRQYPVEILTEEKRKEFIEFLYEDSKRFGEEYALKNSCRLAAMALDEKKLDYFIIYNQKHEIVGSAHCFKYRDFGKIEDFFISDAYQHRGYGNALFMYIVEYLKRKNIHDIILCADNLDTVKEMYYRMGFTSCGQYYLYRKVRNHGKD